VEKTVPVKITRPSLSGGIKRKRLFSLLDAKMEKPVVWISSPAGSGKTMLISSYLESGKRPCIWYRCDERDSDLPTFFYYMGLAAKKAAPKDKSLLPLLTPEYHAGIPAFTRRYFEKLYSRLIPRDASPVKRKSFIIVLDNYQDMPPGSPFHEMIAGGFDMIPEGIRIVVISRSDPPSALARLHANDQINLLEYNEIRFTFKELAELVHGHISKPDNKYIKEMYEKTEGWVAGIILMLERAKLKVTGTLSADDFTYERIFDYFAGEIFDKTDKGVQEFLLKTAILNILSVSLTEKLTGAGNAGQILSALNRHNYFTERLSGSGQDYQYHPLFRDFLLNRAKTKYTPDELAVMQREAALLLEQSGQIEDAARLYRDAGDRHALAGMVIKYARELMIQGRNKTVDEWIAAIPGELTDNNPWLLYWAGMCSFPFDIPRARKCLEKAFEPFKAAGDISGIYLSWAGIVDTYTFELDEWARLEKCIAVFDELRAAYPVFPSKEIDLVASSRMLISLTLRKTDNPEWVLKWQERVSGLLQENPSVDIQMDTAFCMSLYYLWKGEYDRNAVLLEMAEAEIRYRKPSPFTVIRIKLMKGIHYWITAQYDSALNTLSEGLDISEKSGAHVFDSLLWGFRAAAEMAPGNMEMAEKSLKKQLTALLAMSKTLDLFFYHINSAWYAILKGNIAIAAEHMESISAKMSRMGTPYYRALWHIGMAQVAFLQDRPKEAKALIKTAHRISLSMKSHVLEWYSLLITAYLFFQEGRETEGFLSLRRGLSLGRKRGYVHLEFYQPQVMRFLYVKALEKGIEQGYVKRLIRKLELPPPVPLSFADPAFYLEDWPYPVKIHTLGRFEVLKDDEPLLFTGKVQKKPLEMLKAIIALGGMNVPGERLTDALWPDSDGSLAQKSFEMTLSRLRRLLGGENFVRYSAGQLSLDPLRCWVDSLIEERIFGKIGKSQADQAAQLCEKAVGLYKGPFLPSDNNLPWVLSRRERLKNGLLRILITAGDHYERNGLWDKAVESYLQGVDTDNLAELFYQRLMVCYQRLGNKAEAIKTYNRCRSQLKDNLGVEPSAETRAVYSTVLQKQ
jgi:ATP/maltotriose-dependent transcriptional regulator MalT/DNA-binding SARP family transcriptional activator